MISGGLLKKYLMSEKSIKGSTRTAGGRRKIVHKIIVENKIKLLELEKRLLCLLLEVIFLWSGINTI